MNLMCTTNKNDLGLTDASCSCGSDSHSHSHGSADTAVVGAGLMTNTYQVSGMTCSHCVASVTEEVGHLDGVKNVDVQLVVGGASQVTVSSTDVLDHEAVAAAIDEAGYQLVSEPR